MEELTPEAASPLREGRSPSERLLSITLPGEQIAALETLAQRNGVTVSKLVGEMLAAWLKYR
jgi:serine/threonine-protein kinase